MIKLTDMNGKPMYFQPESILCAEESNTTHYTRIWIGGGEDDYKNVQELPEEVARKVLDYKLYMARYKAALAEVDDMEAMGQFAVEELGRLAGLEESQ